MNTVTHPAPTVDETTRRITIQRAMALILAESKRLPCPIGIEQNGVGSDILCLRFATHADLLSWVEFFDAKTSGVQVDEDNDSHLHGHAWGWHGWSVQMSAKERASTTYVDSETAALIDGATADLTAGGAR